MTSIDASNTSLGEVTAFPNTGSVTTNFEVFVCKQAFKFNAAHFVAFRGFREALHGHNYAVSVRLLGARNISHDGYLIDFGDVKQSVKRICKRLNENFLCPMYSDVMKVAVDEGVDGGHATVSLECEDGAKFLFPKADCAMLPIVHATTEELSIYLWSELLADMDHKYLLQRGLHTMEVSVAEAPGQESVFRLGLPKTLDHGRVTLDVRTFIQQGKIVPKPCEVEPSSTPKVGAVAVEKVDEKKEEPEAVPSPMSMVKTCEGGDGCVSCKISFSKQLEMLVLAINTNQLCLPTSDNAKAVSIEDLQTAIEKQNNSIMSQ
mmetsp:Transcript_9943/g.27194  ORF Transcript_9943/g.27194 Transcript_9943/m.27194 type:complete len:319 (-) Transcript_9943:149-1105(-)|eukprot:CAMPEP_0198111858 /NCGR_PEP_ID=MMETSP1442-20131203/3781_1 /TAXON_ID= /ORGANISM="Craspedostauros australis, Strain CCMP3328" /LENGTH=318 /DNA_ID=CAMNT_0043768457 /DNA_START=243 /DNA_END=1199 /DNA_ORIENTATION=+